LLKLKEEIAQERAELTDLKNTTVNLIDVFVQQGLLDKNKAETLLKAAKQPAAGQPAEAANKPGRIRVTHVPEFVKEEIRQQVTADLQDKVTAQVKADAKKEQWGVPAALPAWLDRIKITGDARVRLHNDGFGNSNTKQSYLDYAAINRDKGQKTAFQNNEQYLNTTTDRFSFRERFRIGMEAKVSDGLKIASRLSTTNQFSPVSPNQVLGNTGQSFQVAFDRAFIEYDFTDHQHNDWLSLYAGRFANPWLSTEMQFAPELGFDGFAGSFRWHSNKHSAAVSQYHTVEPSSRFGLHMGPHSPDSVFLTMGVFPIQEVNFSTNDKWLFGGQLGVDWLVHDSSRLKLAAAFYDYENVRAQANGNDSFKYDWTAPQFIQKGNSMVPINVNNGINSRCTTDQSLLGQGCLYGLASDFKIFNATAMFDYADFAPIHALLSVDFAKNLGYDAARISREFPDFVGNRDRTNAYQVRLDLGNEEVRYLNNWSAIVAYRYVERDAVLDAFTDTIFHQGGTDTKGWMIGGSYGIAKNAWLLLRWYSTQSIDGPTLDIDTATLDFNVRL